MSKRYKLCQTLIQCWRTSRSLWHNCRTMCVLFVWLTYFHGAFARWPIASLLSDSRWLTELLSGTVSLTVCVCQCSCVCMACRRSSLSPLALPFAPMFLFAPVPLSDPGPLFPPKSPSTRRSWPSPTFSPSRLLSRRLSLPLLRPPRPVLLSRHPSSPASFSIGMNAPAAACGVNCHKACRGRLAVECRKRTKSISHETPPALQARSYSFPPPANTPPSLQSTGEGCDVNLKPTLIPDMHAITHHTLKLLKSSVILIIANV